MKKELTSVENELQNSTNADCVRSANNNAKPMLAAGILRHFSYSDGILGRYAQIKKQGRVVIRIYEHMGDLWFEKSWFTNFGRKSGKPVKIKQPQELIKYKGNHWSLPSENYEWLVNACR